MSLFIFAKQVSPISLIVHVLLLTQEKMLLSQLFSQEESNFVRQNWWYRKKV